ncbi:MAG: hypothetical protein JXR63_03225 [Spirochaetales bacterium]|nr:hypothetical protein [Spirochaetales bacterium]
MTNIYQMDSKVKYEKELLNFEKKFDYCNMVGDFENALGCLKNIGTCYYYLGKPSSAIDYFDMVADASDRSGDYIGMIEALESAAETLIRSYNDYDIGIEKYREVVEIAKSHDLKVDEAWAQFKMARHLLRIGKFLDAHIYLVQAKKNWLEAGYENISLVLPFLMEYYLLNDELSELEDTFVEYLHVVDRFGHDNSSGYGYIVFAKALYFDSIDIFLDNANIATIHEKTGLKFKYMDFLKRGISIAKSSNNLDTVIYAYCQAAIILNGQNHLARSRAFLKKAKSIDQQNRYNSLVLRNTLKLLGEGI